MRRKRVAISVLVLPFVAALLWVAAREYSEHRDRKLLESRRSYWNWNQSYTANQRQRREELRAIAPAILPLLRRDLNYDSRTRRWYDSARHWIAQRLHWQLGPSGIPSEQVRVGAAEILAELGPLAEPALPDLLLHARDPNDPVRWNSALALGGIGEASPAVLAALTALVNDGNPEVARCVAVALWRLQPEDDAAIASLVSLIDAKSLSRISMLVKDCGVKARPLAAALRQALPQCKSPEDRVRGAAALWSITGDPEPALSVTTAFVENLKNAESKSDDNFPAKIEKYKMEQGLGSAVLFLSDIPEFRRMIKPLLMARSTNADFRGARWAKHNLAWLEKAEAEGAKRP